MPGMLLGLYLNGASDFLTRLDVDLCPEGNHLSFAKASLCIFCHELPPTNLSMFNAWLTYSTAKNTLVVLHAENK